MALKSAKKQKKPKSTEAAVSKGARGAAGQGASQRGSSLFGSSAPQAGRKRPKRSFASKIKRSTRSGSRVRRGGESRIESPSGLKFHPVTLERWRDVETLFGERGACGGCWCMYWRLARSHFERQKGAGNKRALKRIVGSGEVPGILAYSKGQPIAWCSVAPREKYPALERSRILKRVDDEPVWSVVCFFIDRRYRNKGVSTQLLRAAVDYAKKRGARIVEGYPIDPGKPNYPATFAYTGLFSAFLKVGFFEVLRRSETRPIVRYRMRYTGPVR